VSWFIRIVAEFCSPALFHVSSFMMSFLRMPVPSTDTI